MATKRAASALAGAVRGGPAKTSSKSSGKAGGGWAARGWDVADEEVKRSDAQQEARKNEVRRFWIPDGKSTKIIFVDSDPYSIREHNFKINNSWKNWKTCLHGTGEKCPYCEADNRNYFVSMFTVIDLSEFKGRDGKTYKNQIRLFPAKAETLKMLRKIVEKRGSLAGCLFDVTRTGDKSPGVGNMFDFEKRVNLKDPKVFKGLGFKEPPKSINYEEKLAPLSRAKASAWLGASTPDDEGGGDEEVAY